MRHRLLLLSIALAIALPAATTTPPAPIVVIVEREMRAVAPDGAAIDLPAGTLLEACGPVPLDYDLGARAVRMPNPCTAPFRDGFESAP